MAGRVGHHAGHIIAYEPDGQGGQVPVYCSGHDVTGEQTTGQAKVRIQGWAVSVVGDGGITDCPCDGLGYINTTGSAKVRIQEKGIVRQGDTVSIHGQGTGTMISGSTKVRSV